MFFLNHLGLIFLFLNNRLNSWFAGAKWFLHRTLIFSNSFLFILNLLFFLFLGTDLNLTKYFWEICKIFGYGYTVPPPPPNSIYLHPAPLTSMKLHSSLFSSLQPPSSSLQHLNVIRTKILHVFGQFCQI